jgi:glycerate kinase
VQALGAKLLDVDGNEIGFGCGALSSLNSINIEGLDSRLFKVIFEVACDIENPLIDPTGASAIFGPQKGATNEIVLGAVTSRNLSIDSYKRSQESKKAINPSNEEVYCFFVC